MEKADVLIIGAGAAGLMAAFLLSKAGKRIIVLEARDRIGGRIHTVEEPATGQHIEGGAEFIHGNLPVTIKLLEDSKIGYYATEGQPWIFKGNQLKEGDDPIENWELLMSRVRQLKQDLPLAAFLREYMHEPEHEELRKSVTSFVEGYDAADSERTSTLAMREEWENEDQWQQYRPNGGYGKLVNWLKEQCRDAGVQFYLSTVAKELRWRKQETETVSADGKIYYASTVIIAVPLGVLQREDAAASITFSPDIPEKINAAKSMGFGAVIKILLRFHHAFWKNQKDREGKKLGDMGFLFSDRFLPTWWTQLPKESDLLTGWLAGPKAAALEDATDDSIVQKALEVLSEVFSMTVPELQKDLRSANVFNWARDPFSMGGYAYNTMQSAEAKKILQQPVEQTIWFTGEALGKDYQAGTVEVALEAGKRVAEALLKA